MESGRLKTKDLHTDTVVDEGSCFLREYRLIIPVLLCICSGIEQLRKGQWMVEARFLTPGEFTDK